MGMIEGFCGFEIFDSRIFLCGLIWEVFFCEEGFLGVLKKNLKSGGIVSA